MNKYRKALVIPAILQWFLFIYAMFFAKSFLTVILSLVGMGACLGLLIALGRKADKEDIPHAENVVKKKRRFSIKPPHPTLVLFTLILGIIGLDLFLPPQYNYGNWFSYAWLGFWWLWLFPFLFLKIYDWAHVRGVRKGGGGGNPMLRMIGILVLVMVLGFLVLILLFQLIGYLLTLGH